MVRLIWEKFIFWLYKPSKFDSLVQLLQKQVEIQAEGQRRLADTLEKVAESGSMYAKVLGDYYQAAQYSAPQVRVMNDFDEATMEQLREVQKRHTQEDKIKETIKGWASQGQGSKTVDPLDVSKMQDLFSSMRSELS